MFSIAAPTNLGRKILRDCCGTTEFLKQFTLQLFIIHSGAVIVAVSEVVDKICLYRLSRPVGSHLQISDCFKCQEWDF